MSKKISAQTLRALKKNAEHETKIVIGKIDDVEIEMSVKKYLSLAGFGNFVAEMSKAEFTGEEFLPQSSQIVYAINLVKYYTDLKLPDDIEEAYEIINALSLSSKIIEIISQNNQYYDLCLAISSAQNFNQNKKTGFSGLIEIIKKTLGDFNINDIMNTLSRFKPEQLEHLAEIKDLAKAFTNIPPQNPVVDDSVEDDEDADI